MSQSIARLYVHLIFSTKDRHPVLGAVQNELHAYLATILTNMHCPVIKVGGTSDHVHLLFILARTESLSKVVGELKTASSKWLKTKTEGDPTFQWQKGYGAFSVSQSALNDVKLYIENQDEHHPNSTFQEEFRKFLMRHNVPFDERYVWD